MDKLRKELQKAIEEDIAKSEYPDGAGEIHFHWDKTNKLWCLSGTTKGGLIFETDDLEAKDLNDAIEQAIDHLSYDF